MKKSLLILLVTTFLCGVLSCDGDDAPINPYSGDPFVYECNNYNPMIHHNYIKNRNYGIICELSSEEKEEIIQTVIEECPKSVCRYEDGTIDYGTKIEGAYGTTYIHDYYSGGFKNIYKNAVERCRKYSFSIEETPSISCFFEDSNNYSFAKVFFHSDRIVVGDYKTVFDKDEETFSPESWITPFDNENTYTRFSAIGESLRDNDERKIVAYKTETGYLLRCYYIGQSIEKNEDLYSFYETLYVFDELKLLTNYFNYFELTESGKKYLSCSYDRQLSYENYKYDESGETPTKDLSFIKDFLNNCDCNYFYLGHPLFALGQVENEKDIDNMSEGDFTTEVECSYFKSDFSILPSHFYIDYEIEMPYIDSDNKNYNAILGKFNIDINGRMSGSDFSKSITFNIKKGQSNYYFGDTKEGTAVICLLDKYISTSTKYVYHIRINFQLTNIRRDEFVLSDDYSISASMESRDA